MLAIQSNIPFPQADDFDKVVRILNIDDKDKLYNMQSMINYLDGISDRQISYYMSAAMYVGIIDQNKCFTETGEKLRNMSESVQKVELIRILLSDPVFGTVYITEKVLEISMDNDDIGEIIKMYHPQYGTAIYKRRGQTVRAWINWIKKTMNEFE